MPYDPPGPEAGGAALTYTPAILYYTTLLGKVQHGTSWYGGVWRSVVLYAQSTY